MPGRKDPDTAEKCGANITDIWRMRKNAKILDR
jgi:hypothetical protein